MIKIFILFFLILILVILFLKRFSNIKKEYYYTFQESKNIIENSNYIKHFSSLDRKLRKCGNNIKECQNYYNSNVRELSKLEKEMLESIINDFYNLLEPKLLYIFNSIKFIKVSNNIENSMPHTRGRAIVFSERYFNRLLGKYKLDKKFLKKDEDLIKLISHEQFHIFQRYNADKIKTFYRNHWRLEELNSNLPPEIKNLVRANPDALPDNNWLFRISGNNYILPLCVYNSKNSENINDTSNIYLSVIKTKEGEIKYPNLKKQLDEKKLLIDNTEFNNFFGYQGANNYHPHEISASLFEDIVLESCIHKKKNLNKKNSSHAILLLRKFLL